MGMEEIPCCDQCETLKKDLELCRHTFAVNFATLKQKIIPTDLLIKKYNLKSQEFNIQSKKLEEVTDVVAQLQRDCAKYESELSRILLEVEPLRKEKETLSIANKDIATQLNTLQEKAEAAEKVEHQYSVKIKEFERKESEHKLKVTSLNEELSTLRKELSNLKKLKDVAEEFSSLKNDTKKYKTTAKRKYRASLKHVITFGNHLQSRNLLNKRDKRVFDRSVKQLSSNTLGSECEDSSHSESDCDAAGLELEKLFLETDGIQDNLTAEIQDSAVHAKETDESTQTGPTHAAVIDNELLLDLIDTCTNQLSMLLPLPPSPKNFRKKKRKMLSKLPELDNAMEMYIDSNADLENEMVANPASQSMTVDSHFEKIGENSLESLNEPEEHLQLGYSANDMTFETNNKPEDLAETISATLLCSTVNNNNSTNKKVVNVEVQKDVSETTVNPADSISLLTNSNRTLCSSETSFVDEGSLITELNSTKEINGDLQRAVDEPDPTSLMNECCISSATKKTNTVSDNVTRQNIMNTTDSLCASNTSLESNPVKTSLCETREAEPTVSNAPSAECLDVQKASGVEPNKTLSVSSAGEVDNLSGNVPERSLATQYTIGDVNPSILDQPGGLCEVNASTSQFDPSINGHDYVLIFHDVDMLASMESAPMIGGENVNVSCPDAANNQTCLPQSSDDSVNISDCISHHTVTEDVISAKTNCCSDELTSNEDPKRSLDVSSTCETSSPIISENDQQQPPLIVSNNNVLQNSQEVANKGDCTNCRSNECDQNCLLSTADTRRTNVCATPFVADDNVAKNKTAFLLPGRRVAHQNARENSRASNVVRSVERQNEPFVQNASPSACASQVSCTSNLQTENVQSVQQPASTSVLFHSPVCPPNSSEKSVAFLKIGRIVQHQVPSKTTTVCDDRVRFIRKGRLLENTMITGITDDRKFLTHYFERYNVTNSKSGLQSRENSVDMFKSPHPRLPQSFTAVNEHLSKQMHDRSASNLHTCVNLNSPINICDTLLKLQASGFSTCSCCRAQSNCNALNQCMTSSVMQHLQNYLKPHACCTCDHNSRTRLSPQHCKTSVNFEASPQFSDECDLSPGCSSPISIPLPENDHRSPEARVPRRTKSPQVQPLERIPMNICSRSRDFVTEPEQLPESTTNSPINSPISNIHKRPVAEPAKSTKKKSGKKTLRERIADSLRYRNGIKLIRSPTVAKIKSPIARNDMPQYSPSEIDLMFDSFILKENMKRPLSPLRNDLLHPSKKDEMAEGQLAPPKRKYPSIKRKRDSDLTVSTSTSPNTNKTQDAHRGVEVCKKLRQDENCVASPPLQSTVVADTSQENNDCGATVADDLVTGSENCTTQSENEIDESTTLKSAPKESPRPKDTVWLLKDSSSIFLKQVVRNPKTTNQKIGLRVINGVIQLLEPLPLEGHLHVWNSVAERISSSLSHQHTPLLSKRLANWIMTSTVDLLPAAVGALQCRALGSDKMEPVLGNTEKKCLCLVTHIRTKSNMQQLEDSLSMDVLSLILNKNTTSFGRAALCRFHVALCKLQENIEKARAFCYDIMFWIVRLSGPLVILSLGVWPEIFQFPEYSNNSLLKVFIYILMKRSSAVGFSRQFSAQEFLKIVFKVSDPLCDAEELAAVLLRNVKSAHQETSFEAIKALELLGKIEGWQWTNNCLVIQKLWPIFQSWVQQTVKDDGNISDAAMSSYLYLLGCLTKQCPRPNKTSAIEVLKRMDALLEKSLSVPVAWCVQEAALLVVLMLMPFDKEFAAAAITKWLPNNEGNLSSSIKQLLNGVPKGLCTL